MASRVRTRIAPSPTGPLHVGTVRAALYNELFAHQQEGEMFLRIDDTDRERSKAKWEKEIKEGLKWLGINWDGEAVRQSERGKIHEAAINKLLEEELAYQEKDSQAVIFKVEPQEVVFDDLIRGRIEAHTDMWGGDFVIARTPQDPLYHLAVVVDDAEMGITHVIRGEDHLSNTPRHVLLQRALGYQEPKWAHLPLLLNKKRGKLSKRDGEVSLLKYREAGYLPEAVLNYLALLGWNPGDDREFFTHQELVKIFDLTRVQKGGAIFSIDKLNSINKYYLRQKSKEALYKITASFSEDIRGEKLQVSPEALELEQERAYTLQGLIGGTAFAQPDWDEDYEPELLVWRKSTKKETAELLQKLLQKLELIPGSAFGEEELERDLLQWIDKEKLGRGDVLWPMRVALTGQKDSPGPFEVAAVLGKEETKKRLVKALDKLS